MYPSYPFSFAQSFNTLNEIVPKFLDRQVWANSVGPDLSAPRGATSDQGLHYLLFRLHLLDQLLILILG